jgi:uncharacterized protein (DUF58 family)
MVNLLAFILGLFIIAALFRIDFFFYMLYIFFGVYFLSRVWIDQALRHIECRREYTDRAFLGERHLVKLHVRNRGLLPLGWVRVHERLPIQLKAPNFYQSVLSLLPKEETTLTYEVDCRRRGYYELGPLSVSSGDMFGIRTLERSLPNVDSLLVYPQIVPLTRLGLPAQTPFGAIPTKEHIYEDPSRMVGVRAYQSGDSLRHIHWKTSAALGSLQVKRFEPAISITCQILLNLNRDEYTLHRVEPASELAIVTAASIANHLVEKRQSVGLSCNGRDPLLEQPQPIILPPRKGREQLMHILDVLARVQVESTWPFTDLLQQASLHLTWGGTAIVITAHAPNELFEHMVLMQRSGFHVVLVLMDPQSPFPGLRERAKQVGIRAYQVWQESDLNVWRNP